MSTPSESSGYPGRQLAALASQRPVSGAWMSIPSVEVLNELMTTSYDYVGIDCQHTLIGERDAARFITGTRGRGKPIIVRVSSNRPELIGQVLDAGADGIIIPMVNSAAEAEAAVASYRFPPQGGRSFGPYGPGLPLGTVALQERVLCLAMVETSDGVANVDEIVAVDGIDGIYVGPADLGIALGLGPNQFPVSGQLKVALAALAGAARRAGKVAGIHAGAGSNGRALRELEFNLLTLGMDRGLVQVGSQSDLRDFGSGENELTTGGSPYGG